MSSVRGPSIETVLLAFVAAQDDIAAIPEGSEVSAADIISATAELMANDPFAVASANGTEIPAGLFAATEGDEFDIEL